MLRMQAGAPVGFRWVACGLAAAVVLLSATTDADARKRKRSSKPRPAAAATYNPPYAAIVVDANSGNVMHAASADASRFPASLTKVMTLYLLFEQLEAGRLRLDSQMPVSSFASAKPPTKLGLRPGQTLGVEAAIKALITRSANDAATVIAEAIGGSEENFARMMTRKARSLGMSRTTYRNASGLPDSDQVTTARDQATLGRAIQERFPRYYAYFSTANFRYGGHNIRNHNRLLGNVEGVDGIKTGFTRASGFNLLTSMKRGNRHVVAVVLGGRSAGARDTRMRALISEHIVNASVRRTAPMIADASDKSPAASIQRLASAGDAPIRIVPKPVPVPMPAPSVRVDPAPVAAVPALRPAPGSTAPLQPQVVRTVSVRAGTVRTASLAPVALPELEAATPPAPTTGHNDQSSGRLPPPPPGARPGVLGVLPASAMRTAGAAEAPVTVATVARPQSRPAAANSVKPQGWIIQVGAYTDEGEAKQRLASVKSTAPRLLASADPFTETFEKGSRTYYRARFAGLTKTSAEAACRYLKRNDVACLAIKN
ncbi:MAG TPA: serine hydrolase [Xanthobacteraceae bacterium]|nr:serine hydrolase [Xanthobacteraceae bacterium]